MRRRELVVHLFELCNNTKSLSQLHSQILKAGLAHDSLLATKLNSLYAKYASLQYARKVFDETPHRTVYLYNAMLRSYCKEKQWDNTLYLFNNMISNDFYVREKPDNFTIPIALKACAGLRMLKHGKMVHGFAIKNAKIAFDMFVGSALIEFYSKCGQMGSALKVFKSFLQPDVVLWTSMVTGYEQNGFPEEAVAFFHRMVMMENVSPNQVTLVSLVSACTHLLSVKLGKCVHGFVIRRGLVTDLSLINSLLNLYLKTGSVRNAVDFFREMPEKDVISWSSMVGYYAQNGNAVEALNPFYEMIEKGFEPNAVTIVSALQACGVACNLEEGKKIHKLATKKGCELEVSVSTALIDMYMKCLSPMEAADVFTRMPKKDVVSWASMLSGYALNGMASKSIKVFRDMLSNEIAPDAVAMVKVLASCSELGVLQQAFCLHGYVIRKGFNNNNFIGASLIELYSKCGSIDCAIKIFEGIIDKDVVIWSAMIAGYAVHGQGIEALGVFYQMICSSEVRPNNVTFLSILSACSHSGLVEEGIEIFDMMVHEYGLDLSSEHYGIMVDLLGRRGELNKAMDIIDNMPIPAGPDVWGALLGACRIHHNVKIGELAAKNLFQLDPNHGGYYALLSNLYAVDERWGHVAKLRALVKEKGLKKAFGQSVLEVKNEVHKFVADDRLHFQSKQIRELLRQLEVTMREDVYAAFAELLFHDAETV
ncbi:Pentatricopeptide repeat [Melia azedarach]|uniref:Pentatricopeptide repeat n=1 Tax=Melia azedarach TaxID=155640 RepID=A0ACC1Z0N1_MELAZ|nr:Pentatricopeptide repeat [Melia azedarach]